MSNYGVSEEQARGIKTTIKEPSGLAYWGSIALQTLLPLILIFALMMFFFRQVQGQNNRAMSFGQSTARETPKGQEKI
ncbi:MAG: cell division protein FtsH, partial [Patescibacteria group bacterium]